MVGSPVVGTAVVGPTVVGTAVVGPTGQWRVRAMVDQANSWRPPGKALVDCAGARAKTTEPIMVGWDAGRACGLRQVLMTDIPNARVPRPPSCPDQRLPGVQARMLARRGPVGVPLVRLLAGTPDSARKARQLARDFLGDGHPDADTVALIVSELVTNSITHSRSGAPGGSVTISLSGGDAGVLIQVRDDGGPSGRWASTPPGMAAEHGYGLLLVDALADSWGTTSGPQGRLTWCRVRNQRSAPGQPLIS